MTGNRPVALITGGSRGIGAAVAAELSSDHQILVGGRSVASTEAVISAHPSAEPFIADLSDEEQLESAVSRISRLDVLVINAAHADMRPIAETSRDDWRASFEVNVFASAELTRKVLPLLRESPKATVVAINSGLGRFTHSGKAVYAASKHALRAFTSTLRQEESVNGIRVVSIHPGPVATEMQQAMEASRGIPYGARPYLRPESVAAAVALAVRLDRGDVIEELSIRPLLEGESK